MEEQVTIEVKRKHPLAKCEDCPLYEEGKYVPSEWHGDTARMVFVGEAPGANETKQGRPFTGISGKLLDAVMEGHGLARDEAMLTNTVLCRPRGNADPPAEAIKACAPRLHAEIEEAQPQYVVPLGRIAASTLLERNVKITKERVGPPKHIDGKPYRLIPTVHPAACLRNHNLFPMLDSDIGKIVHSASVKWEPPVYKVMKNETQSRTALQQLANRRGERLVIDIETGEDKDDDLGHPNILTAFGIGYEPGKVVVIPRESLRSTAVRRDLAMLLASKRITAQNGKYDLGVLHRMGIGTFKLGFDTMLASYTLDERRGVHSLDYLGQEKLGTPNWKKEFHKLGGFNHAPDEALYRYNAYDVGTTWDLQTLMEEEMDADAVRLHQFLCWASDQLTLIESEGTYIDRDALDELEVRMKADLEETKHMLQSLLDTSGIYPKLDDNTRRLMEKTKGAFNPNSNQQTAGVLGALLNATVTTTDASVLEALTSSRVKEVRDFAKLMLEWREVGKLYGTYVKGTLLRLNEDGRIQTTFKLHGTETGRLSSANPNVQNVPREGGIREVYAAEPGNVIVYADYGNIEGRIVSVLADEQNMQEVLRDPNRDIHSEVTEQFYGPNFTKEQRVLGKTVVHGTNYGRTPDGIAEGLGVSISEARKVDRVYHEMFPRVRQWQAAIKHQVLSTDEVLVTPWGRKRRFGLITRDNAEDVYKEALAFMPQSIGSDICLTAGCRLKQQGLHVRILIHDGIIVECPEEDAETVGKHMREVMEDAGREFTEKVPFPVEVEVGRSWGEVE